MDPDEEMFDINLMKKKKKKKKTFDLNAVLGYDEPKKAETEVTPEEVPSTPIDDGLDLENFGKKKKKRKPKVIDDGTSSIRSEKFSAELEGGEGGVVVVIGVSGHVDDDNDGGLMTCAIENELNTNDNDSLDVDFSKAKKKKKSKKSNLNELCDAGESDGEDGGCDGSGSGGTAESGWIGSDRDYTYDELLRRVYDIIIEKNPEMAVGRKPKFIMRPPQVLRVGTKKTSFANFMDIAKTLHRLPKHLLDFLLAELGTSGSMDGNQQLIIKGRFQAKQIENVLRRYIKEYVTCHTCRSPETILQKDTRIFFLQCESCGSRCSVASIKSGFQAVTGKRAAIRAKIN